MPQLIPFFFTGQTTFVFAVLVYLVYLFSKYVLPRFVRSYWGRGTFTNFTM